MQNKLQTLKVKIPPGVTKGQQIRLVGQGAPGVGNGPRGDLYLEIDFREHTWFRDRWRLMFISPFPITPWEAALGATIQVPTLGGKVEVKIPSGSQTGQKLRLKGRGLPTKPAGINMLFYK